MRLLFKYDYKFNIWVNSDVFCCLGTTRADAGGKENFKRIDQDYVLNSAKIIAEENKPTGESKLSPVHFLYCSTMVRLYIILIKYSVDILISMTGCKQEFTFPLS